MNGSVAAISFELSAQMKQTRNPSVSPIPRQPALQPRSQIDQQSEEVKQKAEGIVHRAGIVIEIIEFPVEREQQRRDDADLARSADPAQHQIGQEQIHQHRREEHHVDGVRIEAENREQASINDASKGPVIGRPKEESCAFTRALTGLLKYPYRFIKSSPVK